MRKFISVVALLVACSAAASGQSTRPRDSLSVMPRARVRGAMVLPGATDSVLFDGIVRYQNRDTVFLARCVTCEVNDTIPMVFVQRLEVARWQGSMPLRMLVDGSIGLFGGAVVGAGIGWAMAAHDVAHCHGDLCGLSYLAVPIVGIGGAAVGLVSGLIVATAVHRDAWAPASRAIEPGASD